MPETVYINKSMLPPAISDSDAMIVARWYFSTVEGVTAGASPPPERRGEESMPKTGEDGGGGGASDAVAITAPSCAPAPPATSARTTRGAGAVRVYDMPRDAGYIAYTVQYTGMTSFVHPGTGRACRVAPCPCWTTSD